MEPRLPARRRSERRALADGVWTHVQGAGEGGRRGKRTSERGLTAAQGKEREEKELQARARRRRRVGEVEQQKDKGRSEYDVQLLLLLQLREENGGMDENEKRVMKR